MFVNKSCQTIDVIQTTKYAFIWSQNVHFVTIIKVPLIHKCPLPETLITKKALIVKSEILCMFALRHFLLTVCISQDIGM